MSLRLLLVFSVAELLLCLTPGPAVLLVISQSMKAGVKSSMRGMLGIITGNSIYFAMSAFGVGAMLMASATLFEIIKWIGAAYLVVVGVSMLISKGASHEAEQDQLQSRRSLKLFSQGLITQLSNPKAIVFFTALLPQFVSPDRDVFGQFLVLGIISIAVEFPVLFTYAWLAEQGKGFIKNGKFPSLSNRIAGGFLIGAGVSLAWIRRP
jgi:homoserine/homoserine lactone efflux protein